MKNKFQVFVWSLFDFGNSSYAVIVVAFVFAVYFKEVVASGESVGDLYWSLGINISMIATAIINPIFGAVADHYSNKKKFLFFFTFLCVIATAMMYFTGAGTILYAIILFILSNTGFQAGLAFYEAFIPEIAEPAYYNKISSIGYAVGYVGSLVSVALVFPFKDNPNLLFVICAMFFLVFSLPLFLFLKEDRKENVRDINRTFAFGLLKVIDTVKNIGHYRNLRNYLLAYFLYIDAVNTIIFFAGNYASSTLKFTIIELAVFFLIVQITAMIGSLLFGYIGDKTGIIKSIFINLALWTVLTLSVFFTNDKTSFFVIGGFAGTFLGSTQSLSRALMAKLTPLDMKTEFFGFYSLFEKTATLLGPLTFGLVSYFTGSQKFAVLSVGVFFVLGIFFLRYVREEVYSRTHIVSGE